MPELNEIKTPRLYIRPPLVKDSHILKLTIEQSFETLHKWMPWARHVPSIATTQLYMKECEKIWRNPITPFEECPMHIFDNQTNQMIGATGFKPHNIDIPSFEVGYWISSIYQGQGYITEAVHGLLRYLFECYEAKRIEIQCEIANIQSAKVAERLGFELEAVLKNYTMKPDGSSPTDVSLYRLLTPAHLPNLMVEWN